MPFLAATAIAKINANQQTLTLGEKALCVCVWLDIMRTVKYLLLALIIVMSSMLWIVMSYSPSQRLVLHSNVLIQEVFQQPQVPVINACVKTVQKPMETLKSSPQITDIPMLDLQVMNSIKTFVLFVGSARSGHSIVGSLMDAHPHVIIAHEYKIFYNWQHFYNNSNQNWTEMLFNLLYNKSSSDASGIRNSSIKGYSLTVNNLWQGKFDCYIEVIGDKCGGSLNIEYMKNKHLFKIKLTRLLDKLLIPIRAIHVVRNPFDQIATRSLYISCHFDYACVRKLKETLKANLSLPDSKFRRADITERAALQLFNIHKASMELIELLGAKNVLEVHSSDFIKYPKETLRRIFEFLEVDASEYYLQVCADKVFKSTSQTRELMLWPPSLKYMIEEKMKSYEFLSRYNFINY